MTTQPQYPQDNGSTEQREQYVTEEATSTRRTRSATSTRQTPNDLTRTRRTRNATSTRETRSDLTRRPIPLRRQRKPYNRTPAVRPPRERRVRLGSRRARPCRGPVHDVRAAFRD